MVDAADSKSAVRKDVLVRFRSRALASSPDEVFFMVYVYVIESLLDQTWYTGMAIDASSRLTEHNGGKNRFTKGHRPWKIIYTESQPDWATARVSEKYLKTAAGKKWLKKFLSI